MQIRTYGIAVFATLIAGYAAKNPSTSVDGPAGYAISNDTVELLVSGLHNTSYFSTTPELFLNLTATSLDGNHAYLLTSQSLQSAMSGGRLKPRERIGPIITTGEFRLPPDGDYRIALSVETVTPTLRSLKVLHFDSTVRLAEGGAHTRRLVQDLVVE